MSNLTSAQLAELNNILKSAPAVNLVTPGSASAAANVKNVKQPSKFMRNFFARLRERGHSKRGGKRRGKGRKTRRVK